MTDLKEHFFTLGKMSWEVCEILRTAFSNNTFGRTRLVIGLPASDMGNFD
jgi:hypothetical protein